MADKNYISTSKKEIYTKLLNVASNYINGDTDFAKTGLFGYITESMAMILRDTTFHTSMMYNESFLNTAVIPKSVYNWAKMFNVEVQKATPAYANIELSFPNSVWDGYSKTDTSEIAGLKTKTGIVSYIKIDRADPIIAGDYYFSLEHSIIIYKNSNGGFAAQYLLSPDEDTITDYQKVENTTKYLSVKSDGENIKVSARAYQYRKTTIQSQIISTTFLNKVKSYTFEDQFCGANLYYIENGQKQPITLTYSDLNTKTQTKTAFYNLTNENELEIIFKTGDELFVPAVNTEIILEILTTCGANVPSKFTDSALMNFSKTDMKAFPLIITFNPTDIIGGKNMPTLSDIKSTIIREISTRNTITTKNDLDNYFGILMSLIEDINNGRIKFVKKRDDILRRIYNSYLLIRDNINENSDSLADSSYISRCVPTNTIDVTGIEGNDDNEQKQIVLAYPKFNLDGQYVSRTNNSTLAADDYYFSPFRILIKYGDYNFVKYIYDIVDQTSSVIYNSHGTSEWFETNYLEPQSVRIYKNFSSTCINGNTDEEKYTFELYILSNLDLSAETVSEKLVINGEAGKSDSFEINAKDIVITSEEQNNEGMFLNKLTFTSPVASFDMSGTLSKILFDDGVEWASENILTFDFNELSLSGNKLTGLKYTTTDKIAFFKDLSALTESSLTVTDTSPITYGLKEVPVIHSSYFSEHADSTR